MTSLKTLWKRGTDFLGTEYAILGGAMTWVSEKNLVSAISNAGGFGMLASGSMMPERLREEIQATQAMTRTQCVSVSGFGNEVRAPGVYPSYMRTRDPDVFENPEAETGSVQKPFGVNLITMHPALLDLIQVCIDEKVSHVALAGGLPPAQAIEALKNAGIKVICFAPALAIAKRLVKLGVDALVIEGMEAGGHIGPVSTTVLAQEILPHITEVPVFVAGGIARGEAIASYVKMGAAGCQLGTLFVCSTECQAHPKFKEIFIRSNARDAIPSPQLDPRFPIIPVRGIKNEGTKKFIEAQQAIIQRFDKGEITQQEGQLEIEHFWAGALRRAVVEGDVETGSVMAGQSVGMVKEEMPVQVIMDTLIEQAERSLG